MEKIKLIIMPDGTAKTINPLGDRPIRNQRVYGELMYQHKLAKWQAAEANRKSYRVDCSKLTPVQKLLPNGKWGKIKKPTAGSIVEAELLNENTVRVVKILES